MATKKAPEIVNEYDPYMDKVIVNIPPPTEEDDDKGMFIAVNSDTYYIAYGVDVEVPRFVKEVLENRKIAIADKKKNAKKFASKEKE